MSSTKLSYKKDERLKSRKLVEHLFRHGKSIHLSPVKVLYDFIEATPTQMLAGVTASKRNFKKAVDRNRIKRVMREGYRLQKLPLLNALEHKNISLAVFFIFTGKNLPENKVVSEKLKVILQRLEDLVTQLDVVK
jgi:ribonuclease P protein component